MLPIAIPFYLLMLICKLFGGSRVLFFEHFPTFGFPFWQRNPPVGDVCAYLHAQSALSNLHVELIRRIDTHGQKMQIIIATTGVRLLCILMKLEKIFEFLASKKTIIDELFWYFYRLQIYVSAAACKSFRFLFFLDWKLWVLRGNLAHAKVNQFLTGMFKNSKFWKMFMHFEQFSDSTVFYSLQKFLNVNCYMLKISYFWTRALPL